MAKKTILLISPELSPSKTPGGKNLYYLIQGIKDEYKLIAITVDDFSKAEKEIIGNVSIIKTKMGIFRQLFKHKMTHINIEETFLKSIKSKIYNILIPDSFIDWTLYGIKAAKRILDTEDVSLIISKAWPYTSHIIGYYLGKKYNIPLILIYNDPWINERSVKRGLLRYRLEFFLEKKIIDFSKKIIFCTNGAKNSYLNLYGIKEKKAEVIYFGYDPENYDYNIFPKSNYLYIVYGGRIQPEHRDLKPFLYAVKSIKGEIKIKVDLYLSNDRNIYNNIVNELGLEEVINIKPPLAYKEFCKHLRFYDYLLLLGNKDELQIPSKVYDYIGSRRPILFIDNSFGKHKEIISILSLFDGNVLVKNEVNDIKESLYKLYNIKKAGQIRDVGITKYTDFSWEISQRKFSNLIKETF
jgi:glycosyltransferase involved in cell wall biosynthesis